MSGHVIAFTVIMEEEINDEYAERMRELLFCLRGVRDVKEHVSHIEHLFIEMKVRAELEQKLRAALHDP